MKSISFPFTTFPMQMPNRNYRKGYRVEREIYYRFKEEGFKVYRSAGSHTEADLVVEGLGSIQVKARKSFGLYNLFEGADLLVIKADRKEPLLVIPLKRFLNLLGDRGNANNE